jgi:DeoR family transcriptional regulator, fructose operon transcriptional repressor
MFAHERHRKIVELLTHKQRLKFQELQLKLGVSPATLRRDLTELEVSRHIVRVHGGIVHPDSLKGEPSFDRKKQLAVAAKRAMAIAAAELVKDDSTVFIDAGTSALEVGKILLQRPRLKIVTNSVPFLMEACAAGYPVISLGGEVRPTTGALIGANGLDWSSRIQADWAFLGASGLSLAHGVMTTELTEAAVKQSIIARTKNNVLVADASKWEITSLIRFGDWSSFSHWITSADLAKSPFQAVQKLGPNVIRVKISVP